MRRLAGFVIFTALLGSLVFGQQLGGSVKVGGQTVVRRAAGGGGGGFTPCVFTSSVLDNFNRADANPLDGSWTQGIQGTFDGTLKVASNVLTIDVGGLTDFGRYTWNTALGADQEVFIDITTRAGSSEQEVWGRLNNAGASGITGYVARARTDTNDVVVLKFDNDSAASVLTTISQTLSDGDHLGLQLIGNNGYVCYKVGAGSWAQIGSAFDASGYTSGGKIGTGIKGVATADNFGGGNR